MTIKDYLAIVRQRLLIVLVVVVVTTSSALMLAVRQTPEYQAKSRLLVVPLPMYGSGEALSKQQFQRSVATEAEIVKSAEVAKRVIERLQLDRPPLSYDFESLISAVTITPLQWTEVLEIVVIAPDPKLASDIANALPEEYISFRRGEAIAQAKQGAEEIGKSIQLNLDKLAEFDSEMRASNPESTRAEILRRQRAQIVSDMATLEATRQSLINESPLKTRGVGQVIQYAKPSGDRANSDLMRTGVLGFIIGLPLALGLALLLDAMSDTIKSKEEAERIVGMPALGVIPLTPEWRSDKPYVVTREAPYSAAAEAFRTLRVNIDSLTTLDGGRRILFTSPGMGEGKTTTSANLGVAFAESGRSALLISADLRRPKLHKMFGIEVAPGLADLLAGSVESHEAVHEPSPNLYLLPSGILTDRPDQLLSRVDIRQTLDDINVVRSARRHRPRNDENGRPISNGHGESSEDSSGEASAAKPVVYTQPNVTLVDAPSVLGAAEVSALAPAVDGVVLVLQAGVTRREAAARAAEQIRRTGGKLLGIVLIGVRMDNDYSVYPPSDESIDDSSGDSPWAKVVGSLRS